MNSGYDYEFISPLEGKYECAICLLAIRNPRQTSCGHRFCFDCIISWLSECSSKECPIDKKSLNENDLFHDSFVEREILSLKVKCPNRSLGCQFQSQLKYIEDHIQACVYQPVLCPNECSITVLQSELEEHLATSCLHRLVKCRFCEKPHVFSQEQLHLDDCPLAIITCDLCNINISREKITAHKKDKCPSLEMPCILLEHGCQYHANRSAMKTHMNQAVEYHIQLLSAAYKKIHTLVLDLHRNIGLVATGNFSRQPSFKSQLSTSSLLDSGQPEKLPEQSMVSAIGGQNISGSVSSSNFALNEKTVWSIEEESKHSQSSTLRSFSIDSGKENFAADAEKNYNKPSISVNDSSCQINQDEILRDLSGKSIDIDQRVLGESIKISNVTKRVIAMENEMQVMACEMNKRFCNGILIWKIPSFIRTCNLLKEEKKILHSQPFYSSQFGYKFCLRTNVFQDQDETFLTLYIHMMQGENDDFLQWPFRGQISLQILDCGDDVQKRHFVEDFEVSSKMEAFNRPKSFKSIKGYGFKEFISLNQIASPCKGCIYLKDNSLYIKAVVSAISQ